MDGNSDLLIISHSFVRRLQEYMFRRNDSNKVVGADIGISEQFSKVFYRGIWGLTLDGLMHELPLVRDLAVRGVILDIGSNDLSAPHIDPVNLAKRIVDFAKLVATVDSVAEVVVCQILPHVMVGQLGSHDFQLVPILTALVS